MTDGHGPQPHAAGADAVPEDGQWSYRRKFEQMDREAGYTLAAAVFIFVCFWGVLLLLHDDESSVLGMPLWFVLSCLGGYLLSVAAVILLVRFGMRNFPFGGPPRG